MKMKLFLLLLWTGMFSSSLQAQEAPADTLREDGLVYIYNYKKGRFYRQLQSPRLVVARL